MTNVNKISDATLHAEKKQCDKTDDNCELPRITHINTSDTSETKKRLLTEGLVTHIQELNKRKGNMNTDNMVSALNATVSALVSRHVISPDRQRSNKNGIAQKKMMTEVPRKMRALTRLNDHLRRH
ncbi:MAG: hypothetical protein ACKO96_38650, partial [Flammeovirgaceae bacterium]